MLVKDIVAKAFTLLDRPALADKISKNQQLTDGENDAAQTMLFCFNAVEDEVARSYIRLIKDQEMTDSGSGFTFAYFMRPPISIISVVADGKELDYKLSPTAVHVEGVTRATVRYAYAPKKKSMTENSEFGDGIGENLFAYGAASEYCLINGEVQAAELWESKYRQAIDAAQAGDTPIGKLHAGGYIPPRRWV